MDWPVECEGCGTVHNSPESENVHTNKENYEDGRVMKAFVCLNCIEPAIFNNSKRMKKLLASWNSRSPSEGFLGRENITSEQSNFLEK